MKINIFTVEAITKLAPNANFRTGGQDEIFWDSPDIEQPSEADIITKEKELQAEYDALQYQRDRQYPSIGDQLDMLFHDMTAGKGSKTGEWYKAIAKVKADNPK